MGKLFRLVLIYPDGSIHPGGVYISKEELEVTQRAIARALAGENKNAILSSERRALMRGRSSSAGRPCTRFIPCTESGVARTEPRGQYNAN